VLAGFFNYTGKSRAAGSRIADRTHHGTD